MLKVPNGLRWVGRIYILGVTVRFSFDCVNSRKIQGLSKIKQRERLMKVYIIYSPYWLHTIDWCGVMGATIYFTLAWGFRHCSFRLTGAMRRSTNRETGSRLAPRFRFCISKNLILTANQGVVGLIEFRQ